LFDGSIDASRSFDLFFEEEIIANVFAELVDQGETVEAGRDEEGVLLEDLGFEGEGGGLVINAV
jgi:hypothetical protein